MVRDLAGGSSSKSIATERALEPGHLPNSSSLHDTLLSTVPDSMLPAERVHKIDDAPFRAGVVVSFSSRINGLTQANFLIDSGLQTALNCAVVDVIFPSSSIDFAGRKI
jgi:hypothetical protein